MSETRYALTSRVSKDGTKDAVHGAPGPVGAEQGQEEVVRYPPWGLDYRMPTEGQVVLVAPAGSNGNIAEVGARHTKYKPDYDDDQWSFTLYNEVAGTTVKFRTDGGIQIKAKGQRLEFTSDGTGIWTSASGGTIEMKAGGVVSFNGGTNNVIRVGDSVTRGPLMAAWMASVEAGTPPTPLPSEVIGSTVGGNPKVQA